MSADTDVPLVTFNARCLVAIHRFKEIFLSYQYINYALPSAMLYFPFSSLQCFLHPLAC
eukprot:c35872_g1_i1 orf=3-176(-)